MIAYESFTKKAYIIHNGIITILPENNLKLLRRNYPEQEIIVLKTSLFK